MYFLDKQKKSLNEDQKRHSLKKAFLTFRIVFSPCFCYEISVTALSALAGKFCVSCGNDASKAKRATQKLRLSSASSSLYL
jgi:anaerobic ribonucleoside-triphosphate reductase